MSNNGSPTNANRRRSPRVACARDVRIEQHRWLTIWSRTENIGEGGMCALLPGGAGQSEFFSIHLSLPNECEVSLDAQVRWSSPCREDGRAWVGFAWVAPPPDALARLDALFRTSTS